MILISSFLISEDGTVLLHDSRTNSSSSRASGRLDNSSEFTDVQYHPQTANLFATSDSRGDVCLRDVRMAFASGENTESAGVVLKVSQIEALRQLWLMLFYDSTLLRSLDDPSLLCANRRFRALLSTATVRIDHE